MRKLRYPLSAFALFDRISTHQQPEYQTEKPIWGLKQITEC
ncbi:MAG: hypothetical protein ACRC3G_06575 [Bacteroidales bacterium]